MFGELSLISPGDPVTPALVLLSLVLSVVLSWTTAAMYQWTFRGMSYSRSFVHSMCLGAPIACMLMLAINNSIAAGLGIAGSLAFIRFRTSMRDPKDMVFLFAALGAGIACGLRAHGAAVMGTLVFCLLALTLAITEFGQRKHFDGVLRINLPKDEADALPALLKKAAARFSLMSVREVAQGTRAEYVYQLELRDGDDRPQLLEDALGLPGATDVSFLMQDNAITL